MGANPKQAQDQQYTFASAGQRAIEHQDMGAATCLKLPEGMQFFQPKAQTYMLDFMPYLVKFGNSHAKPGVLAYERTYCRHERVGGGDRGKKYACLQTGWGEPCVICQKLQMLNMKTSSERTQAEQYIVTQNKLKERQLFLVLDLDQPAKKIQVFEYSYHLFGKKLDSLIKGALRVQGTNIGVYDTFYNPTNGYTLRVTFEEKSLPGGKCLEAASIEFHKRTRNYKMDIVKNCPCLDEVIIKPDVAELKKTFLVGMADEFETAPTEDNPYATEETVADDYPTYAAEEVVEEAADLPVDDLPEETVEEVYEQSDDSVVEDVVEEVSEYQSDDTATEYQGGDDVQPEETIPEEPETPQISTGEHVSTEYKGTTITGKVVGYAPNTGMYKVQTDAGKVHLFEGSDLTVIEAPAPKKAPAAPPAKKPAAPAAAPAAKKPAAPAAPPAKKPAPPATPPAKKPVTPLPGKRPPAK